MVRDRFNATYVATQLKASSEAGGLGWLLWDANNDYSVGRAGVAEWLESQKQIARITPPAPVAP
jgi:hypothetical protein